jgi:phosphoglycolate phosphatase-like HAD superfamily hydrolase
MGWTCHWVAPVAKDPKQKPKQRVCTRSLWSYLPTMTCSVLLDLDGTLVDSQPGISASCVAALRALGHEADESLDIRFAIGPPLEDMMQILLQHTETTESVKPSLPIVTITVKPGFSEAWLIRELANPLTR